MSCSIIILIVATGFAEAYDGLKDRDCYESERKARQIVRSHTCWRRPIPDFDYAMVPMVERERS